VIEQIRRSNLASRFHFLRYEDLALRPEVELNKLLESLSIKSDSLPIFPKDFCPSEDNIGQTLKSNPGAIKKIVEMGPDPSLLLTRNK